MTDNRCRIYREARSVPVSLNKGRYSFNSTTDRIVLVLNTEHRRWIGFERGVISLREMSIRRAGIDDKKTMKLTHNIKLATEDDSLCGEYLLERENEDVWRLVRIE